MADALERVRRKGDFSAMDMSSLQVPDVVIDATSYTYGMFWEEITPVACMS